MTGLKAPSPTANLRSLGSALLEKTAVPTPGRQTLLSAGNSQTSLQQALANRDAKIAVLRQQLSQLTADFNFNLSLLTERDSELERQDAVLSELREAAAAKELAATETRHALAQQDAALREKDSQLSALEERHRQTAELCERQVADARAARDEEVARCQAQFDTLERQLQQRMADVESSAAREKSDIINGYESQITSAIAAERESRQVAQATRHELDATQGQLQRAEAKVVEQEAAMQRMVSKFEGALQALQQLEGQYNLLASDAAASERTCTARIEQLETEVLVLRNSAATQQREHDSMVSSLTQQVQERDRRLAELKQQHQRSTLDHADLTDSFAKLKRDLQQSREELQVVESQLRAAQDSSSQAQAALDRESSAHAQTRGMLETTRLSLEAARRDYQALAREVVELRESAAVSEAQRLGSARALEAANAKVQAGKERLHLLSQQLEREKAGHARALAIQEEQLAAQAERALSRMQEEKTVLQEALGQSDQHLQQAYREMETLRLQLEHVRLAPGALNPSGSVTREECWGGAQLKAETGHARAATQGSQQPYPGRQDAASTSSTGSGDVFSDAGDGWDSAHSMGAGGGNAPAGSKPHTASRFGPPNVAGEQRAQLGGGADGQQDHVHRHFDALGTKLSSFELAVEKARQDSAHATIKVGVSAKELPAPLQQRQAEVTEGLLKERLAREREQFLQERRRLDKELAEKERLLQERDEELRQLQKDRESQALEHRQRELSERERHLAQLAQRLQHGVRQQAQQGSSAATEACRQPHRQLRHQQDSQANTDSSYSGGFALDHRTQQQASAGLPATASAPPSMTGSLPSSPACAGGYLGQEQAGGTASIHVQGTGRDGRLPAKGWPAAAASSLASAPASGAPSSVPNVWPAAHASTVAEAGVAPGGALPPAGQPAQQQQQPGEAVRARWAQPRPDPAQPGPGSEGGGDGAESAAGPPGRGAQPPAATRRWQPPLPLPQHGLQGRHGEGGASRIPTQQWLALATTRGEASHGPPHSLVTPRAGGAATLRQVGGDGREQAHQGRLSVHPALAEARSGSARLLGPARRPGGVSAASSLHPSPAGLHSRGVAAEWGGLGPKGGGALEDPLTKARRQVILAKDYLRQVAEMGGKLSRSSDLL